METVELGNIYYFMYLIIMILIILILHFILRKKSKKFQYWFLFGLLVSAFSLHFLKLLLEPYYSALPYTYSKSTFENICAVSTIIFPFIFLSKNKILKDYMVIEGLFSGFFALIIPTGPLDQSPFIADTYRYYYAHLIIFIVPLFMAIYNIHTISIKRVLMVPVIFIGILGLILINDVIIMAIGLVNPSFETLIDPNINNVSFIYGIPEEGNIVKPIINLLVPKFLRTHPITHEEMYWPLVWLIIPTFVLVTLASLIICFIFQFKETKSYFKNRITRYITKTDN